MHKPKKLAYTEEYSSRTEAMRRERRVKTMGHERKLKLIESKVKH
jgi:predicted GIY-YIG superfamily endonuclease